jgi:hypothetical protein
MDTRRPREHGSIAFGRGRDRIRRQAIRPLPTRRVIALDEERSSPPGLELVPAFGESERVQPTQYVREPPSQSGGMKGTDSPVAR